jgi:D-alanyl-D-alanine carboxypeptidase/Putative peptidoglycan binding domain
VITSYNGWSASPAGGSIGVKKFAAAGTTFPQGVRSGDVGVVLTYVANQLHRRVEKAHPGWCWGFNYRKNRNADNLSCHASGTAIDWNAPRHPNGRSGTFSDDQVREIRAILAEVEGVVRWGGDFSSTKDEMHFEIAAGTDEVASAAAAVRRRTGAGGKVVSTITRVTGTVRRPPRPTLQVGGRGDDVRNLQHALHLEADGIFGKDTLAAVTAFQKRYWPNDPKAWDGVVGPKTWKALRG